MSHSFSEIYINTLNEVKLELPLAALGPIETGIAPGST